MPGQISIKFRNFWGLDPSQFRRARPPGRPGGSFQDSVLRITIAVDVDIVMASVSGMLILNAPPVSLGWPPSITGPWRPEVIGIGIALTVGISPLPVDISVMPGRTWIKPITP